MNIATLSALESARLVLSPVGKGDVPLLVGWWNDATVRAMHGLGLEPLTQDAVRQWLAEPARGRAWIARDRSSRAPVGVIEMSPFDPAWASSPRPAAYELGLALDAAKRGQGYGREMVERLCAWAFEEEGAAAVTLEVMRHNRAALHTFTRAGFVLAAGAEGNVLRMQRLSGTAERTRPQEEAPS